MQVLESFGLVFSKSKLKPYLKMASQRIAIANNRKTNLIKQNKREIARLLQEGKEEKARIRVENVIREDFTIEAYEILALLCDLLGERVRYIASEQSCPPDLYEAVCTLIYAANKTEIPELLEVRKQLGLKYGTAFIEEALTNRSNCVNERIVHKLAVSPPSAFLVVNYLKEIAKQFNVEWEPTDLGLASDELTLNVTPVPSGFSVPMAPGSELSSVYQRSHIVDPSLPSTGRNPLPPPPQLPSNIVDPPPPYSAPEKSNTPTIAPASAPPPVVHVAPAVTPAPGDPSLDELEARFAALRK